MSEVTAQRSTGAHGNVAKSKAPAVERTISILNALSGEKRGASLTELAAHLSLPKSSVHGICAELERHQIIQKGEKGQITIGAGVMRWASGFLNDLDVTQEFYKLWESEPSLKKETVILSVLNGAHITYIACRNGQQSLGISFRIGMQIPACFTATGKAMLSTMPDELIRSRFEQEAWPAPLTSAGPTSIDQLLDEVQLCRLKGYSRERGEIRAGIMGIGAPVYSAQEEFAVAGMAVSLVDKDLTTEKIENMGNHIRSLANKLSQRLGGRF